MCGTPHILRSINDLHKSDFLVPIPIVVLNDTNLSDTQPYNDMTPVRRQANIMNHMWDVDKGIFLDIIGETWNKMIL